MCFKKESLTNGIMCVWCVYFVFVMSLLSRAFIVTFKGFPCPVFLEFLAYLCAGSMISTVTLSATGLVVMLVVSACSWGDSSWWCGWCWWWPCGWCCCGCWCCRWADPWRSWWAAATLPGATELLRLERTEAAEALLALPCESSPREGEPETVEALVSARSLVSVATLYG